MANIDMPRSLMSCLCHTFQASKTHGSPLNSISTSRTSPHVPQATNYFHASQCNAMLSYLQHIHTTSKDTMSQGTCLARSWLLAPVKQFPLAFHSLFSNNFVFSLSYPVVQDFPDAEHRTQYPFDRTPQHTNFVSLCGSKEEEAHSKIGSAEKWANQGDKD